MTFCLENLCADPHFGFNKCHEIVIHRGPKLCIDLATRVTLWLQHFHHFHTPQNLFGCGVQHTKSPASTEVARIASTQSYQSASDQTFKKSNVALGGYGSWVS